MSRRSPLEPWPKQGSTRSFAGSSNCCPQALKHLSVILTRQRDHRHTVKNVRPEGSTVLYVQRLATAFFLQSAEASREFDRCFPGQRDRCSALLMWAEEEVEWFAERLDKQVFNSQSAISVVAACVAFLRRQAERLLSQGLDLLFMLDSRLQSSVEKVQFILFRGASKR